MCMWGSISCAFSFFPDLFFFFLKRKRRHGVEWVYGENQGGKQWSEYSVWKKLFPRKKMPSLKRKKEMEKRKERKEERRKERKRKSSLYPHKDGMAHFSLFYVFHKYNGMYFLKNFTHCHNSLITNTIAHTCACMHACMSCSISGIFLWGRVSHQIRS